MGETKENIKNRIKVLLVDDEEGYISILAKRMKRRDFDVTTALSGSDAILILRKQDFDAAVLDLKLKDMDGLEVLKIFKKMIPEMPVIMLTGHATIESAIEGMKLGAFDYLMKPCDMEELVSKVCEAAKKKRRHKEKIIEAQLKEITMRRV